MDGACTKYCRTSLYTSTQDICCRQRAFLQLAHNPAGCLYGILYLYMYITLYTFSEWHTAVIVGFTVIDCILTQEAPWLLHPIIPY